MKEDIRQLLEIQYPIIQAGMVWVSGANLAAASANAGCLGTIGAGSMDINLLDSQIKKAQAQTNKSLAVNLPLLYHGIEAQIETCLRNKIKIFITSAGSPKKYTQELKKHGAKVLHVISTPEFALKAQDAGVDAVIAEGFEAGGHNGRDEITTLTLIPQVSDVVKIPVIAAGGIVDHRGILAAFNLGAQGVQMGTRFLMTQESSAHLNYKNLLLAAQFNSTDLVMKALTPVRLLKNQFYEEIKKIELSQNPDAVKKHLGTGRAKQGMLMGDLEQGELEIGQGISLIKDLPTVQKMVEKLIADFYKLKNETYSF
jgi:enoyl-[acyl-carrier protein] reductase II